MADVILVTGGVRSGKSRFAERTARRWPGEPVYIATAEALDEEMAARIATHQAERGDVWRTIEAPLDLCGALTASDGRGPRLVDCLTLWLTNLILAGRDWRVESEALAGALAGQAAPAVLVTNEVGAGIVPDNALARVFRDAAGLLNQKVAARASEVYLVTCGLPLRLK